MLFLYFKLMCFPLVSGLGRAGVKETGLSEDN